MTWDMLTMTEYMGFLTGTMGFPVRFGITATTVSWPEGFIHSLKRT
jgi:hypothetical protein